MKNILNKQFAVQLDTFPDCLVIDEATIEYASEPWSEFNKFKGILRPEINNMDIETLVYLINISGSTIGVIDRLINKKVAQGELVCAARHEDYVEIELMLNYVRDMYF